MCIIGISAWLGIGAILATCCLIADYPTQLRRVEVTSRWLEVAMLWPVLLPTALFEIVWHGDWD